LEHFLRAEALNSRFTLEALYAVVISNIHKDGLKPEEVIVAKCLEEISGERVTSLVFSTSGSVKQVFEREEVERNYLTFDATSWESY
jgi:hypothetical protein